MPLHYFRIYNSTIMSFSNTSVFPTGKKSSTWFATGNRSRIVHMLPIVYAGLCCYCWLGTILCNGSWHPHILCIFQPWNAVGSVSKDIYCTIQKWQKRQLLQIHKTIEHNSNKICFFWFYLGACRYIITAGAVTALCSTLMGSMLPQVSKF